MVFQVLLLPGRSTLTSLCQRPPVARARFSTQMFSPSVSVPPPGSTAALLPVGRFGAHLYKRQQGLSRFTNKPSKALIFVSGLKNAGGISALFSRGDVSHARAVSSQQALPGTSSYRRLAVRWCLVYSRFTINLKQISTSQSNLLFIKFQPFALISVYSRPFVLFTPPRHSIDRKDVCRTAQI